MALWFECEHHPTSCSKSADGEFLDSSSSRAKTFSMCRGLVHVKSVIVHTCLLCFLGFQLKSYYYYQSRFKIMKKCPLIFLSRYIPNSPLCSCSDTLFQPTKWSFGHTFLNMSWWWPDYFSLNQWRLEGEKKIHKIKKVHSFILFNNNKLKISVEIGVHERIISVLSNRIIVFLLTLY